MSRPWTPSRPRRRSTWLVWIALLFACAQAAASAHAISHLADARARDGGLVHAQCDLCLLGASIGGAAPAAEPLAASLPPLAGVVDFAEPTTRIASAPALAYRSRAPPSASR